LTDDLAHLSEITEQIQVEHLVVQAAINIRMQTDLGGIDVLLRDVELNIVQWASI